MKLACTNATPLYNSTVSESSMSKRKYRIHYNISKSTKYISPIKTISRVQRCNQFKLAKQYLYCTSGSCYLRYIPLTTIYDDMGPVYVHEISLHAHNYKQMEA